MRKLRYAAPFALAACVGSAGATSGCSSAAEPGTTYVADATSAGYVAEALGSDGAPLVHLDVQDLDKVQRADVVWSGGEMVLDAVVTSFGVFPDGLSLGYVGTVSGPSGTDAFDVAPRTTIDTAHYTVQAGPGEVVVTDKASGAVLSMGSDNGLPTFGGDNGGDDDDDDDAGVGDAGAAAGEPAVRPVRALDQPLMDGSSRVRFAAATSPCTAVAARSSGGATTTLAVNGSPVSSGGGSLVTTSAALRPDGLIAGGSGNAPLVTSSSSPLVSGCGEPLTQPVCSADKLAKGTCLVASAQSDCFLSSLASSSKGCAVMALASTGICAAGTLVTTLGTGELLCVAPGAATLVCGITAILASGVASLACQSSGTRQVKRADPGDCTQDDHDAMNDQKNLDCANSPSCTTQMIGKTQKTTCELLSQAISNWTKCVNGRTTINDKCFKGGNDVHQIAANQAMNGLAKCQDVFNKLGCPSS